MSCIYCNDDPRVADSCYCRILPDVLHKGIMDGAPIEPVQLGPEQQVWNQCMWFPFFSPRQNKLFNKLLYNSFYGLVR